MPHRSRDDRRRRLGIRDHDRRLSRAEFAEAIYDEPWRHERVKGKLSVLHPEYPEHQIVANRLRDHLGCYELSNPEIVDRVFSNAWISIGRTIDRIIDIGVYLCLPGGRRPGPERPPELAYEVISGGGHDRKRDYFGKRAEYLRAGVMEYVIVDRRAVPMTVLRRSRGRFVETHLQRTDTYTSSLLPGFQVLLAEMFRGS